MLSVAAAEPGATPFISITAWGLGPTGAYITGFFARMFVSVATALFWSKPLTDFEKQLAEIEEARTRDLFGRLSSCRRYSPMARRRAPRSGEASMMKDAMGVTKSVSRASMVDLCLKLGEKVASGEEVPQWVGIANP